MQVVKRDGRIAEFNLERIVKAIMLAMSHTPAGVDIDLANKIALSVEKQLEGKMQTTVYEIQDTVEKKLMGSSRKEVAQEYITYRYNRDVARKSKTKDMFLEIIETKSNDITRENANMNADTPAGMMMKFSSETTKPFVDDFLLSTEARKAHQGGYIHIHDKDYYPTKSLTCLQHPLNKLLEGGFRAGHGSSRPSKRIETASMIGCISLETVQNEMHGGQAIPNFDYYLAPYVRRTFVEEIKKVEELIEGNLAKLHDYQPKEYIKKDLDGLKGEERYIQSAINATVGRVHQAMEAFIHNMNTIHSRGGNQVVFSSINYGTDTTPEGRCIIREMLASTERGVGNGETPIFPIQIFKKKRGVNYLPEDRNYDLYKYACKVTSKRFFPNFVNLDATFNQHEKWDEKDPNRGYYEVATMGCRTRVFANRHGEKTSVGRGNISFTTVNLVKLAIESAYEAQEKLELKFDLGAGSEEHMTQKYNKTVKEIFMQKLDDYLGIAARQLFDRYKFQSTAIAKQFPLLMSGLWQDSEKLKPEDTIADVLKQGTLSIGFIGLAEALTALTGKHHAESDTSQELGLEIVGRMNDACNKFSDKYDLNYSLLATPAEGLSGRFTRMDKKQFGNIIGVTDKDYYTNSNHVPVWYKCTAEKKAKTEAPYHKLTPAGHIFYIELDGDATHNPETIEAVVDLMDKYNMGYGSINHTRSRCLNCGFENSDKDLKLCPICGSDNIDTIQRITGYLVGTTSRWNKGKLAELHDRVTHN
ncbi:MAG: anaerobic ribonucleoside triphosphate reductase [Lachnospiraceae bacterium]|jgi:ribonucleoside-triphosphate reductase|nr:anaerobic ribonucleoside triphosphate reductase [Lachnospiraceae bacterium]